MTASVVKQIESLEANILTCEQRLEQIDRSKRLGDVNESNRNELKSEKQKLKQNLIEYKNELRTLRKENFKNAILAAAILTVIAVVYMSFFS